IMRVAYRYRGKFQDASIGTLLEDLEVSQMCPRAVRLKGKILGRGEPGAFWSPDLVLRDASGIMFILYRHSICALHVRDVRGRKLCWTRGGHRRLVPARPDSLCGNVKADG